MKIVRSIINHPVQYGIGVFTAIGMAFVGGAYRTPAVDDLSAFLASSFLVALAVAITYGVVGEE